MYNNERMIKNNIILWSIVLIVAIAAFVAFSVKGVRGNGFNFSINFDLGSHSRHSRSDFVLVKEQVITDNITDISIEWISDYVDILKSENNEIKIVQKAGEKFPEDKVFSYKVSGGKLSIKDGRKNKFKIGININEGTGLEIYLPEKKFNSINVSTTSADLDAGTLTAEKLIFNTTSGNIKFSGMFSEVDANSISGNIRSRDTEVQKLNIDTTSGNARVSGSFERVELNTISGKIEIQSSEMLQSFKSSSVSGDVTLAIPENDGFTIEFDKVSGNIDSEFAFAINGDRHVYKKGGPVFKVDTVSGNFDILKN